MLSKMFRTLSGVLGKNTEIQTSAISVEQNKIPATETAEDGALIINLVTLGIKEIGDTLYIKLPDKSVVEVELLKHSVDFSHRDDVGMDSNFTLACTYSGKSGLSS